MIFNLTVHLEHLISILQVIVMQETLPYFPGSEKKKFRVNPENNIMGKYTAQNI